MPIFVIPEKAGIQDECGCRIKSGMTTFAYLTAGLIIVAPNAVQAFQVAFQRFETVTWRDFKICQIGSTV